MAYCQADTSAKVGFRPYHRTNPFAAAHLSGVSGRKRLLGTYYLNRPFDPWELYPDVHATAGARGMSGLGQNHPFKPQAWYLHGVPLEDAIQHLMDRAHQAASRGDTITAQTFINTLKGLGSAPAQSTFDELVAAGYDPIAIEQVMAEGASNEQFLALPYPASPDEMGAALYALQAQLAGAPSAAGVPASQMQTSIPGYLYSVAGGPVTQAAQAASGPVGTVYSAIGPDAANQAAIATLGPAGSLVATARGTPLSVAAAGTPAGRSLTAVETWLASNAGWVLLGLGGFIVLESLSDGGSRRRR